MGKNSFNNTLNMKKIKKVIESGLDACYNQVEKLINGKRVREKPKNLYSSCSKYRLFRLIYLKGHL
jgi:hypothetical protein